MSQRCRYAVFLLALMNTPASSVLAIESETRATQFPLTSKRAAQAAILISPNAGSVERMAAAKLAAGIQRDSGTSIPITDKPDAKHLIVLGIAETHPVLADLAAKFKLALEDIPPQGYLLRTQSDGDKAYLFIVGSDPRGVLYGAQEALDQVVTCNPAGDAVVTKCESAPRKPAVANRGTYCLTCWGGCPRYDRAAWEMAIDSMADAGMNRIMFWMDGLFRSERHPGAFLNKPKQHFEGAKLTNKDIHKLIAYAHDRGMDFYFGSGVFGWFTAGEYIARNFKGATATETDGPCPSSPIAQKVTQEYLSEMIEVFPEADGYMLEIRDELDDCHCATCQKPLDARGSKQFGQSEMDFLAKLTTAVWKGHPKTKFIWLMGYANHNEDVLYYQRLRELGRDPRLEWLEVRNSWTLPAAEGGRKPLHDFSDRIYHWDAYYKLSREQMQDHVRKTVAEGLNGYLPAHEPGFANASVYATTSVDPPFPVHWIPFCLTQFYYREFTWDPAISRKALIDRSHHKFFTAEVPRHMADDMLFLRQFMADSLIGLNHVIGKGLGPDGSTLLETVADIWTVPRRGGDERKKKLLEGVRLDIQRLYDMAEGTGDMARAVKMEKVIAELRPTASGRSRASFELIERAITDMRARMSDCKDYIAEAPQALDQIDRHLAALKIKMESPASQPN